MYGKKALLTVSQNSARPTGFMYAVERLQEEREGLMNEMKSIYIEALEVGRNAGCDNVFHLLADLRARTEAFVSNLDKYLEWEDEDLFPLVDDYFHKRPGPSITPSYWGLEKDREMGMLFIQSFLDLKVKEHNEESHTKIKHATSHMAQACLIMQEYFRLEAELLFPLADEILTDIDYFYS